MRFTVAAEDLGLNRLPGQIRSAQDRQASREDGVPYQLNPFDRTDQSELSELENRVATFLDQQERLFFWYRNRPCQDYYVQGWGRGRMCADFLHAETGRPGPGRPIPPGGSWSRPRASTSRRPPTPSTSARSSTSAPRTRRGAAGPSSPRRCAAAMRFEVVDEAEWQRRLTELLAR